MLDLGGWAAIDAPFGFPAAFSRAVYAWQTVGRVESKPDDEIIRRITDKAVHDRQDALHATIKGYWSSWPLSPVVERITPTTVRCMQLLTSLSGSGPADRIGTETRVIETYPIAALRLWGIDTGNYKNYPDDADTILNTLCETTGLAKPIGYDDLHLGRHNDAVDGLVCALVARTAELAAGHTAPDPVSYTAEMTTIRTEGWIHLPPDRHNLSALNTAGIRPPRQAH